MIIAFTATLPHHSGQSLPANRPHSHTLCQRRQSSIGKRASRMDLKGKHLVYVGGFGGIGSKCIAELLQKGVSHLCIFDVTENGEFLAAMRERHGDAHISYVHLDITDRQSVAAAYQEAAARMQHIDVVINGSGIMNDRLVEQSVSINLMGVIHSTLQAIDCMDKSRGGRGGLIVNISSVFGLEPMPMLPIYTATKFGVTALTRSFANPLYYDKMGISFVTVCPGATETALLADLEKRVLFDAVLPMAAGSGSLKRQTAAECAANMVKVLETATNGSVWMLDVGGIQQVDFPTLWEKQLA